MRHPRFQLLPDRAERLLWLLPLMLLGLTTTLRIVAGEPIRTAFLIGVPLSGLLLMGFCRWWGLRMRRELEWQLDFRTRELEASQAFLQDVVDSSPAALIISDARGRVTFASRAAERLLGRAPQRLVGTDVCRLYPDGVTGARRVKGLLDADGGKIAGVRMSALTRDGREVPVDLTATFLRDRQGYPHSILAVLTDLSDRLDAERKTLDAERLRILGESVAGIAHELNNPLTGVIGYLQLLLDDEPSRDRREVLRKAGREASRMARTIRTLLGFVRRRDPERVITDIDDLARQVVEFEEYRLRVHDVGIDLQAGAGAKALVDPDQIKQVLLNLVKNAADAMEESGVGSRIVLRTAVHAGRIRIEVEDDGPGVPPHVGERVFEHFFTTKPSGKGTGLGLSICRQVLEAHDGGIRLTDAPKRGACFVLDLPVADPAGSGAEGTFEPPPPGLRILVVDDEAGVRDYVTAVLRGGGHTVLEASGGREAVEVVQGDAPDVAFVDMKMPDMSGAECRAALIACRAALAGRVVLMSGDLLAPEHEPYLTKPMSPEEILRAAGRAVQPAAMA